jgi:16S rRNA G1207 methylase RsmC
MPLSLGVCNPPLDDGGQTTCELTIDFLKPAFQLLASICGGALACVVDPIL